VKKESLTGLKCWFKNKINRGIFRDIRASYRGVPEDTPFKPEF
jgi:hypothetical protein